MEVSYYPGCSLDGTAREYAESTEAVCEALQITLRELKDWNCCGASSAHATSDTLAIALPARNLQIADEAGMDILVPCAACYQRLKRADKELASGTVVEGVNGKYKGSFEIKYIVDFFWENVGEQALKDKVKKPLAELNVVCYYGCLAVRPPEFTDTKDPENPQAMDNIMKSLGANVKDWSYKTDCCGGSLLLTRPDIAEQLIWKILDMAQEAEADCIVTGCPMCFQSLDSKQASRECKIPILYLSEIIGIAFGDRSAGKWLRRHIVDPRPLLKQKGLI